MTPEVPEDKAVEIALDVEVDKELTALSAVESPDDSEAMPVELEVERLSTVLATVLNPLEVEVDSESRLLEVEVESEARSLLALLRLVDKAAIPVELEVDRLSTEL
jgi:pilus assembly protein FimV